ncbi:MAG: response regulator transcription factor [Anaerolineae bacterium]|nr:response regulator transcription factor [Anaerolineae bacterium]
MTTIIVVDDDLTNTSLLQMFLEIEGFQVMTCKNIEEAKTAVHDGADGFIVDCHLAGGVSGLSLLRDIRSGETAVATDTPVIMASGDHRLETESLESGANRFMLKPYSPTDLAGELSKLLAKREHSG